MNLYIYILYKSSIWYCQAKTSFFPLLPSLWNITDEDSLCPESDPYGIPGPSQAGSSSSSSCPSSAMEDAQPSEINTETQPIGSFCDAIGVKPEHFVESRSFLLYITSVHVQIRLHYKKKCSFKI